MENHVLTCCESMRDKTSHQCAQHGKHCPDRPISMMSNGKLVLQAPNSYYRFEFCPWCGTALPDDFKVTDSENDS